MHNNNIVVQCAMVKCGPDSRKLQHAFFNILISYKQSAYNERRLR